MAIRDSSTKLFVDWLKYRHTHIWQCCHWCKWRLNVRFKELYMFDICNQCMWEYYTFPTVTGKMRLNLLLVCSDKLFSWNFWWIIPVLFFQTEKKSSVNWCCSLVFMSCYCSPTKFIWITVFAEMIRDAEPFSDV